MKGGSGGPAPGDYVYFKSVVPLHKISVSARARLTPGSPSSRGLSPQRLSVSPPLACVDFSALVWSGAQPEGLV